MIQLVMVFGIGFLSAGLLGLAFTPLVHWRAVRLTMARLDAAIPASVEELRAEKDQMRAQVATSLRRLEVVIEHLKKKNVAHQTEITKKTGRLTSLEADCTSQAASISALEEKNTSLQDELSTAINERDTGASLLLAAQRSLAEKEKELGRVTALASEQQRRLSERDLGVDEVQSRLQKSEALIAALQRDLSRTNERRVSVTDLHREIDRLEARIEMMAGEMH